MSRDIRSFLILGNKSSSSNASKNNKTSADCSTDVIPNTPSPLKNPKLIKKKRRRIDSDSDDSEDAFSSKCHKGNNSKTEKKNKPALNKEVKAIDFFGKEPVKRTSSIKKQHDVIEKNEEKTKKQAESDVHDDKNFTETLIQLDEKKSPKNKKTVNGTEIKTKNETSKDKLKLFTDNKLSHSSIGENITHKTKSPVKKIEKTDANKSFTDSLNLENSKKESPNLKIKNENEEKISSKKMKTDKESIENANIDENNKTHLNSSNFSKNKDSILDKNSLNQTIKQEEDVTILTKSAKKRKNNSSFTQELTDEERHERKRCSTLLYRDYLNRSGPKNPGSKIIPEGSPNCLSSYSFVITGELDSLTRDDAISIITRYGGNVKSSPSGKVTHMICGDGAGPAKLAKAEALNIKIISEDDFINMIEEESKRTTPEKKNCAKIISPVTRKSKKTKPKTCVANVSVQNIDLPKEANNKDLKNNHENCDTNDKNINEPKNILTNIEDASTNNTINVSSSNDLSWVEKYRPKALKYIIGQQNDSCCAVKLSKWLSKWYESRLIKISPPNPWSKGNEGYYKAALLSGPPGVGKTTTAHLVCKELGFDMVEFNASDTRSKTLIKEQISELTSTNSLAGFVQGKRALSKKHVIIMDEVDGMAGNEDRGGIQELITLIKSTGVPIICICNDKTSPKMRSLVNHCFDLTFNRPKIEQIKAAMRTICFKEGIKISPNSLDELIVGASQDIRQILNLLSVWSAANKIVDSDSVTKDSKTTKKDIKMGPWQVLKMIFSEEDQKHMNIHEKSSLFFHDYSLIPLFIQHNYLKVTPKCSKNEILDRFANASDCLSMSDLVDAKIRRNMSWNLLPVQAMFSSVMPGSVLMGQVSSKIDFPAWLGQNSRTNKMNRLAQELHSHTRLSTSGSKQSMRLDYAMHIRDAVLDPLIENGVEGVQKALDTLQSYNLLREDLDSLSEMTTWAGIKDKSAAVESKVKAALTRKYNKDAAPLPYSQVSVKRSQSSTLTDSEFLMPDTQVDEIMEDDSDLENDAMIKKAKKSTKSQNESSKNAKADAKPKQKSKRKK